MSPLLWVGLAAALVILELISPFFVAIFVAAGGLAAALSSAIGLPIAAQFIALGVVTIASLSLVRGTLLRRFANQRGAQRDEIHQSIVGARAVVTHAIAPHQRGQIRVGLQHWSARVYGDLDLAVPIGSEVQVIDVRGVTALVADRAVLGLDGGRHA